MFSLHKRYFVFVFVAFLIGTKAYTQNINNPNKPGPLGTEVNTLSGNLFLTRSDIYVPSRGVNIALTFYYNSFNFEENIGFGKGWSSMYSIYYKNDTANGKKIIWGDAREDNYKLNGSNYIPQNGIYSKLTQYQPNKFLVTEQGGMKYFFDNATHKKVTRIEEPNGNFLNFSYTDTLLTTITNTAGQSIALAYNANGNLQTITDALTTPARVYNYAYDNVNNLKEVTDPLNGKAKYTYLVNGPMKTMSDKNNNTVDIIYYGDYTVSEIVGCNKRQSFSYDTTLQVTTATDYLQSGSNQVTKYQYNTFENISWLTGITSNCCGYNMTFEYDSKGNKIKQNDANGNISTYNYDNRGNMVAMKDASNQTMSYTYSTDFNRVTSYTDAKGFTTNVTYDIKGNLIQIVEPGNLVYTAAYNPNGDIISSADPKGNTFTYNYDALGNPTNVTGPNGYNATLGFDARGNLLSYKDARNNISSMEYDILGRMKKIIDPINNNIQLTYDAEGNATLVKNQNAENSLLKYDASNRLVQFTDPMGNKTNLAYDAMDNITSITNAVGANASFSYDTKNRLIGMKDALGNQTSMSYDAKGNIISANLPNGDRLNYTYDNIDRITQVSDINGTIAQLSYDKNNNVTSFKNGTGASTLAEYDSLNRVKKITDALGNSSLLAYDKNSNVTTITDRNGITKTYTYDSLNRVKTATDNNGSITTVNYDAQGNIISLKDANNNTTNYTYDNLNRVKRIIYPDSRYMEYTYDSKGNVTTKRLTDATNIVFTYDTLNRIVSKLLPDGQINSYTYDAIGRVKTATNNAGTVTLNYDLLNRIVSESFAGRTVNYAYNTAGRTQTTVYPDSTVITKVFDTRNRLSTINKNGALVVSYQYNNADQLISKTAANGVVTTMQYDNANRLINYTTANNIQNANISYDNEMQKTAVTRLNAPAKSEQFVYDNGQRLTNYKRGIAGNPVIQNTYNYDALGNRTNANLNGTNTNYTTNNLNQLTNSNNGSQNINFTYDNRGNLTFDGNFYKTYDAENRLVNDSASTTNVLTYLYDAFGRRTQKNNNGTILNYTFSGLSQIEERDAAGLLKNKTIFNNFITPVANEKDGASFYYHQNELNSVEIITNNNGRTMEKYEYDVYGKQTRYDSLGNLILGSITSNRFGYTGQVYDSATASNKFLFREYNPEMGTFNERDLIGYGDGMGMYQYVGNNPANGVDVFGLNQCPPTQTPNTPPPTYNGPSDAGDWTLLVTTSGIGNITSITPVINDFDGLIKIFGVKNTLKFWGNTKLLNKILNQSPIGNILLTPFNLKGTYNSSRDLGKNWSTNSYGQNVDGAISVGSGSVYSGIGVATTGNFAIGAYSTGTVSGGLSAAGATVVGTGLVALGGGLAIFGVVNEITKATSGRSIAEHGETMEIPGITGAVRWWYGGNYSPDPPPSQTGWKPQITYCPQNGNPGGTRKRKYWYYDENGDSTEVIQSFDPNAILGPDGVQARKWVSVNDILPYTILFENDKTASAPAKYVKIIYPIDNKQAAGTFNLSSFGFNNQTFTIPPNTPSYSQRLDARDSIGLFVDITAGLDVTTNQAFWEFQSIDPLTLLPPTDPTKGFLLLQDSTKPNYGHGFVNFSIKPKQTDITLDTIHAEAKIVFDGNDTIPTNYHTNTVDAFAPTSHMNPLPSNSPNPVQLSWTGTDDVGGSGVKSYTLYVSTNGVSFYILKSGITRTDTTIRLAQDSSYCFFVLATDSVGNMEALRPGEIKCTIISGGVVPVSWLYFKGTNQGKDNLLEWATTSEINTKEFKLERSFTGNTFTSIATLPAQGGNTNVYPYKDASIDKLNSNVFFYRVKQIDIDGKFAYSNVVRLNYNVKEMPKSIVYPNPTQNIITITIGDKKLIGTMANLFDINGRKLETIKIKAESQSINLSKYTNGTYIVVLENKEVLRILKQ
jgi:RHS repeat-associated protein